MERLYFFFFNDTATTEIYTLSLHDALPIFDPVEARVWLGDAQVEACADGWALTTTTSFKAHWIRTRLSHARSEEHTSELQSRQYLVCRLLLEKKKTVTTPPSLAVNILRAP